LAVLSGRFDNAHTEEGDRLFAQENASVCRCHNPESVRGNRGMKSVIPVPLSGKYSDAVKSAENGRKRGLPADYLLREVKFGGPELADCEKKRIFACY
jgi:hypothetical protein